MSKTESTGNIGDQLDKWLKDGGDTHENSVSDTESGLLKASMTFTDLVMGEDDLVLPIIDIRDIASNLENNDLVSLDPIFCRSYCQDVQVGIAAELGSLVKQGSGISIDFNIARADEINGVRYRIWNEPDDSESGMIGRVMAIGEEFAILVDSYVGRTGANDKKFVVVEKHGQDMGGLADIVDNVLIVDLAQGYKPYNNAYRYYNGENAREEDLNSTQFELKNIYNKLLGHNLDGDVPTPELV